VYTTSRALALAPVCGAVTVRPPTILWDTASIEYAYEHYGIRKGCFFGFGSWVRSSSVQLSNSTSSCSVALELSTVEPLSRYPLLGRQSLIPGSGPAGSAPSLTMATACP
jgi:hypothetical protein